MFVKKIKSYRDVIAICDEDLLGKTFEDGNFQLNVKEKFYGGEVCSEGETLKIIEEEVKNDATFNIVGLKSVNTAIKSGIITKNEVRRIKRIPFALVLI